MIVVIGLPLHAYRLGCSIGSTAMVHAGFAGGMGLAHPIFSRSLSLGLFYRHCEEPTGRANARPMTGSATKQSSFLRTSAKAGLLPPSSFGGHVASIAMTGANASSCSTRQAQRKQQSGQDLGNAYLGGNRRDD